MKSRRAFVDPVTLYILVGLAVGVVLGSWKPLNAFKKPPPTAQLTELQAKLEANQAAAVAAAKEAEAAKVAERAKLEGQIRLAQADNLGAATALARVPTAHQTPEVKLAQRMTQRVSLKLAAAIGRLPIEQQEAMVELIEQALSDKQSEVDEANQKLAALDTDFKATTAQRDALRAEIPKLTERAAKAEETTKATQNEVTAKTNEVKEKADSLYRATQENNTLLGSIKRAALLIGGIYCLLAFGLPAIVKHLDSANPFKPMLRDASGYFLNPLTYHDAKKKLSAFKPPTP